MRFVLKFLYRASAVAACACLLAIFAIILAQILLNLLDRFADALLGAPLGIMIPSYAEFSSYLLAASMFLGFASALNYGTHVRVVLALQKMPPNIRKGMEVMSTGIGASAAAFFAWRATVMVYESWLFHDLSYGLIVVPMWVPQAPMAIGLAILTIAFLDRLVNALAGRIGPDEGEGTSAAIDNGPGE